MLLLLLFIIIIVLLYSYFHSSNFRVIISYSVQYCRNCSFDFEYHCLLLSPLVGMWNLAGAKSESYTALLFTIEVLSFRRHGTRENPKKETIQRITEKELIKQKQLRTHSPATYFQRAAMTEVVLRRPFLMVTTLQNQDECTCPFGDNAIIRIVSVELSLPYASDEVSHGRCRWKKVYATTDKGVKFLLSDDTKGVKNARQYGSQSDPQCWGSDLPGYTLK